MMIGGLMDDDEDNGRCRSMVGQVFDCWSEGCACYNATKSNAPQGTGMKKMLNSHVGSTWSESGVDRLC
eukprot:2031911-Amphidinium_carterae.1